MVADILSTDPTSVLDGPTGATLRPPRTAPRIVSEGRRPGGFDFSGVTKPRKLPVDPAARGHRAGVERPDRIAADYLGQVWEAKEPFQDDVPQGASQFSVGLGGVVPAWDKALAGLKEGARVMIICPPELAYGATASRTSRPTPPWSSSSTCSAWAEREETSCPLPSPSDCSTW